MTLLASTPTPHDAGYAVFALVAVVVTLGYGVACWLWPFRACRRCTGTGKRRALFGGRAFGFCRRCDGTGRALRLGRRVGNHLRELKRNAR